MNTTANIRSLNKDEKKQLKESGDVANLEFEAPFLGWQSKNQKSQICFFDVDENALIETALTMYATLQSGIFLSVFTSNCERIFSFKKSEYSEALDFYNKMVEALKNNNI